MKVLKSYWKLLLGLLFILVAAVIYFYSYLPAQAAYEPQRDRLNTSIQGLQTTIAKNSHYSAVTDKIPDAQAEILESRRELYQKFPVEMKEEDQIMYVLYLEELFGTEINFDFGTVQELVLLSDSSKLCGLTLTVNYECSYDEFQEMISYLATDEKITSVSHASMEYDAETDTAVGTVTIVRYLMDSELLEYVKPDVNVPDTGKDNIFE